MSAVPEITLDQVIARRFELVDAIAIKAAAHKVELDPLTDELKLCEMFVKDAMNKANTQSQKITGVGMAYFTTKSSCKVTDFDSVIRTALSAASERAPADIPRPLYQRVVDHLYAHGLWSLFTKAVAKDTVKEFIGIHKAPPTGVEYSEFRDLNWKRESA